MLRDALYAVIGVSIDPFGIDFLDNLFAESVNETLRRALLFVRSPSNSSSHSRCTVFSAVRN